jgi:hypothetical protein
MSNLSRRSLVSSAAALPALAVPAAAIAATTPADFDKAAIIRRAEELVEIFSTRYIREGWHENFDKARAAEFLEDVPSFSMAAQDAEHEAKILAWTQDHGVSLDWLLAGDHGALITYRACHAAPRLNEPDPIYAAINDFKKLCEIENEAYRAQSAALIQELRDELEDAAYDAASARIVAMYTVFETVPTTLEGMRAKIDFAMSVDHVTESLQQTHAPKRLKDFLETLYECAARLIVAA